eukprot:3652-Heterococcus_DN1.PRE.1
MARSAHGLHAYTSRHIRYYCHVPLYAGFAHSAYVYCRVVSARFHAVGPGCALVQTLHNCVLYQLLR